MKKVLPLIIYFATVFLWSCSSSPNQVVFPASKKATLTAFEITEFLAWPDNLLILGDKILLYDTQTDWVFKIFSKEDFEHKGNLLRRGRGPGEELNVTPFSIRHGEDAFLFQGSSSLKIADVQYRNNELSLAVREEYALPAEMYGDYEFFLLNDKFCSSNTFKPTSRDFRCSDLDTDSIFEWGELTPVQRPKSLSPQEGFLIAKYNTVHPEGKLLAVAYQNLPILRIYCGQSGQMLHQLHVADASNNKKYFEKNLYDEGFLTYYVSIRSTSGYIYALYWGSEVSSPREDYASVLHVWKWDGTPVMTLELDRPIYSFDVTPDNKQIIAVSLADVDNLFMADIPWD